METYEVMIVGASLAGSSTALFLSRFGVSSVLLDRANFPRRKSCGEGLAIIGLREIETLGVPIREEAGGVPFSIVRATGEIALRARTSSNGKAVLIKPPSYSRSSKYPLKNIFQFQAKGRPNARICRMMLIVQLWVKALYQSGSLASLFTLAR